MQPVAAAFHEFVLKVELSDRERAEASRQQNVVRDNLRQRLDVERDIVSGSYSRRTAIRPLHDIDLFVILDAAVHGDLRRQHPEVCLGRVREALADAYPAKDVVLQRRSVNVQFSGTGIGFDVVPAFGDLASSDSYWIPDRDASDWIRTNPEAHRRACVAANERAGGMLNALIKAAKHWNREAGKPLKSFHLETMAYDVFRQQPESYAIGLRDLFGGLAQRVGMACPEPAGLGLPVDHGMSRAERENAWQALQNAHSSATAANTLAADGYTEEAHYHWRTLLGSVYPEAGKSSGRTVAAGMAGAAARRSVDAPDKRFG